ncbi:LysR family transcriptional regulator [Pikeienuella piscinae]|uniref:LysR family transcriptional regulator n=1 Tax=Pikeienuella piscinae TaxID=2748098 RepID=A0A7L5C3L1_9RHOB|nr:LysR family transcriptional regulator [Pikeienuella piscinae]QIE56449.1 LysR family transcriptional regulator [Pikeienuella piscinae]
MARNLDLTALRSFMTVADTGKVTAAAARLNLTQSAVSMQLKRLEDALGQSLLDRAGRGVALTSEGELLLGYARRMITLNDEIWGRMTHADFEGELVLGVPCDIVYPQIPQVMRRFARDFPRVKVSLTSSFTTRLKAEFARGEIDLTLTTESDIEPGGEMLDESWLVWVGAHGGTTWKSNPVKLAYERSCIFRPLVQRALEAAGLEWEMAVESDQTRPVEAAVSADLAIHTQISSSIPPYFEVIQHGGALPELPAVRIGMYLADGPKRPIIERLAEVIRETYGVGDASKRMAAE